MKKLIYGLLMVCLQAGWAGASEQGLTLQDCYHRALKNSETIAIHQEQIEEVKAQAMQALSVALPDIAFVYQDQWQDTRVHRRFSDGKEEARFTFSQPLFTGFKAMAAVRAHRHLGIQKQEELKRAKQLLFSDVADAFYWHLTYQEDLLRIQKIEQILLERLEEMQQRHRLGKSRFSEVVSVEANLRRIQAEMETIKTQLDVSALLLEFLIGMKPDVLVDAEISEDVALDRALLIFKDRADIRAAKEAVQVYDQNIRVARSSLLPTVALNANYYTKRYGVDDGNDWDIGFVVHVPLFHGLTDYGLWKQAKKQKTQMELRFQEAIRLAYQEVQSAHTRYKSYQNRLNLLALSLAASEKNYHLQKEDYEHQWVGQLDVLQALEDLSAAERLWLTAKSEARRAFWMLKVAIGEDIL